MFIVTLGIFKYGYLTRETSRAVYVRRFRKALDEPNPVMRFRVANDAYKALARRIGSP
jgi:hypothetical protein